jgi:PIN domain nuclease of toxin-antitoxin system
LNLLLDTHLLLWTAGQPERLSKKAREALLAYDNRLFFSSASLWEIGIKQHLGRSDFHVDARRLWRLLLVNGYQEVAVSSEHALTAGELPPHHKDPFDRILIAQASVEGFSLLTVDRVMGRYGKPVVRV